MSHNSVVYQGTEQGHGHQLKVLVCVLFLGNSAGIFIPVINIQAISDCAVEFITPPALAINSGVRV